MILLLDLMTSRLPPPCFWPEGGWLCGSHFTSDKGSFLWLLWGWKSSLCVGAFYSCGPPPCGRQEPGDKQGWADPKQVLPLHLQGKPWLFQGPQIIGRQRVEKSRGKKKAHRKQESTIPPIKICQMGGEDAYNSPGFPMYLVQSFMKQNPEIPGISPKQKNR